MPRVFMFNSRYHFNPRAYVRHDQNTLSPLPPSQYFNPRAYVRHDHLGAGERDNQDISIHVPT